MWPEAVRTAGTTGTLEHPGFWKETFLQGTSPIPLPAVLWAGTGRCLMHTQVARGAELILFFQGKAKIWNLALPKK